MAIDPQITPHHGGPMSEAEYLELDRNATNARYEYIDGVAKLIPSLDRELSMEEICQDINFGEPLPEELE